MTKYENSSDDIGEGPSSRFDRTIVVIPPFVFDSELGVTAVDVAVTGQLPKRTSGRPAICFGGHPPDECLLDITGSGTDQYGRRRQSSSPRQSPSGKGVPSYLRRRREVLPPGRKGRHRSNPSTSTCLASIHTEVDRDKTDLLSGVPPSSRTGEPHEHA